MLLPFSSSLFFFFNDTATTEIYTLSLHDALPIYRMDFRHLLKTHRESRADVTIAVLPVAADQVKHFGRSEEHTSELKSRLHLVCRLLLEKKKKYAEHGNEELRPRIDNHSRRLLSF